ncbi:MAG: hypothetical protein ACOYNB_00460 [Aquabacterium sp.]|uniref:hypothetical protein n=1 Tax=Aquabacterium sp. TaxID=1872578 RepID=UPI003BC0DFC9
MADSERHEREAGIEFLNPVVPFDWWRALIRVLASIEAVRDGRALYVLLATFCGAGLAMACAQASLARDDLVWAIGQGAAALFVAFYGVNAAGLLLMDRALARPARDVVDAMEDALGIGHRVLLTLLCAVVVGVLLAGGLLGLYWLSSLPKIGPWLFTLVVPLTVVCISLFLMAVAVVVAPLTGPTVWAGASAVEAIFTVASMIRTHLLQAAVLSGGLSLVTGLVGAVSSLLVVIGGRVMAEASVLVLGVDIPPEALMGGLIGQGIQVRDPSHVAPEVLQYISAATVGGGVVFAIALVLPTLVYLRGVCEIYLTLQRAASDEDSLR